MKSSAASAHPLRHQRALWLRRLVIASVLVAGSACGPAPPVSESGAGPAHEERTGPRVEPIEVPAPPEARAPELRADGDGVLLTWLRAEADEHVLELARWSPDGWSPVRQVARGPGFFANWADRPGVVRMPDRSLLAWWLAKLGEETYAYGLHLARSEDDGATWTPLGLLHDDASATEHGFVAWTPEGERLRAFWLDGRAMADEEPMELRTALVGPDGAEPSEVLDRRVCECCALAATTWQDEPFVVYRDRSEEEVRDIAWVARDADGWSAPRPVAADGWTIHGCPVNGPAVVGSGQGPDAGVAVAWYTAAAPGPRVSIAFSSASGGFGPPTVLDGGGTEGPGPLGRVDLARAEGDPDREAGRVWVSWLAAQGEEAEVVLQPVTPGDAPDERLVLGRTSARRVSGVPRLEPAGEDLLAVWLEDAVSGDSVRLRAARVRFGA